MLLSPEIFVMLFLFSPTHYLPTLPPSFSLSLSLSHTHTHTHTLQYPNLFTLVYNCLGSFSRTQVSRGREGGTRGESSSILHFQREDSPERVTVLVPISRWSSRSRIQWVSSKVPPAGGP